MVRFGFLICLHFRVNFLFGLFPVIFMATGNFSAPEIQLIGALLNQISDEIHRHLLMQILFDAIRHGIGRLPCMPEQP